MSSRCFSNPFKDYDVGDELPCPVEQIKSLIAEYVNEILKNTQNSLEDERGDLYVGNAGIAFMFLRLAQSPQYGQDKLWIQYAGQYIEKAKNCAIRYSKRRDERCAFLCGNAGIYAVAAAISHQQQNGAQLSDDVNKFRDGIDACLKLNTDYGNDEILVGRAGYLSGVYWLNKQLQAAPAPFQANEILDICNVIVGSGREYSQRRSIPLMYQYHGTEYLGAAHGVCAILHMLLNSPWFGSDAGNIPSDKYNDIKDSVDAFISLQESDGNFPVCLESRKDRREKRLVHWCHGAPGAIYLLAVAYLKFKEPRYLAACRKAADLVWHQGLLYKGPGICHGVAGNGYVFLIMYRLTQEPMYLHRAYKFMEFLMDKRFKKDARVPDRPFSLYEGIAGTVCFLIDLLNPATAEFPFMDIFN